MHLHIIEKVYLTSIVFEFHQMWPFSFKIKKAQKKLSKPYKNCNRKLGWKLKYEKTKTKAWYAGGKCILYSGNRFTADCFIFPI